MAMTPSEITALMSSGQSLSAVANQLQNAGVSLEDVSKASGASISDLNNILVSGGVSYGSYGAQPTPAPTPAPPAAGTPAIAGKTGQMDVLTGQFKYYGTPEYDAWLKGIAPELNAYGIAPSDYLKGGVGATLMNNPLTQAYSSAFAENNTGLGGGQAWAEGVGGLFGFGKQQGYIDQQGYSTGKGNELTGGLNPTFAAYRRGAGPSPSPTSTTPPVQRAPSYTAPVNTAGSKYPQNINNAIVSGGYSFGNRNQMRPYGYGGMGYSQMGSMYPYQNYGRQGMFGGTASSRMPYTGYQAYQPYGGYGRNTGMFGAPTMNYNMRNRPMQQITPYSQMGWSQNNPWSY